MVVFYLPDKPTVLREAYSNARYSFKMNLTSVVKLMYIFNVLCSGTIRVLHLVNLLFLKVIIFISVVLLVERYQIVKYLENNYVSENIYLLSFVALALPTSLSNFFCPSVCPFVCRTSHLRNHRSSNHNFWYTSVK